MSHPAIHALSNIAPEIGFYGEFDPFGGGVSCRLEDFPRLLRELSLFLLVKDIVIFSPGCMLDHTLTLLACEALAPFTRMGRLTTTASPIVPTPTALIDQRAAEYLEILGTRSHKQSRPHPTTTQLRRKEVLSIVDRWHAILPSSWRITRDEVAQVERFATAILNFSMYAARPSQAMKALRRIVEDSLSAGHPVNRPEILNRVAVLRPLMPRSELAQTVLAVQSLYFKFGVESHEGCSLYPGSFARFTERYRGGPQSWQLPTIDWNAEPAHIEARLGQIGIDVTALLNLPVEELARVVASPEWMFIRAFLRGIPVQQDLISELNALFTNSIQLTDTLGLLSSAAGPLEPIPRLSPPRQLAANAALGVVGVPTASTSSPTLDLCTNSLAAPGIGPYRITATHVHLLTALAASGEAGLTIDDLEQLILDIDCISSVVDASLPQQRVKAAESDVLARARASRVRTLISRANDELAPLDLRIVADRGHYKLEDQARAYRRLSLCGTLWTIVDQATSTSPPEGLSPLQARLWRGLADRAPQLMAVPQIAAMLGKPCDERGKKQVTEALQRLAEKLVELGVPWRVAKLSRGTYALFPLTAEPTTEVR
jgi:hypothetical protein